MIRTASMIIAVSSYVGTLVPDWQFDVTVAGSGNRLTVYFTGLHPDPA
jgi:hypothetical protein